MGKNRRVIGMLSLMGFLSVALYADYVMGQIDPLPDKMDKAVAEQQSKVDDVPYQIKSKGEQLDVRGLVQYSFNPDYVTVQSGSVFVNLIRDLLSIDDSKLLDRPGALVAIRAPIRALVYSWTIPEADPRLRNEPTLNSLPLTEQRLRL